MKNLQVLREEVDFGFITNAEYLRGVVEYLDEHDPNRAASVVEAMNKALASIVDTWKEWWVNTPDYVKNDLGML